MKTSKISATTIEVVNYEHGLTGDKVTWRAPHLDLSGGRTEQ